MVRNQRDETFLIQNSYGNAGIMIDDLHFVANGSNNVIVDGKAPVAVGTDTIGKWLQFRSSNGTVFYIPTWT